ncbi:MAG TPA: SRPBCC family protein [Micromonosporaceae bacterium]|nr:SRPBCC family protein [Micromonosporaceae bacterium]
MEFTEHITTSASRDDAWAALTDVTDWPRWTTSMREVRPLGADAISVGNKFRVTQPGLPRAVWTVSEVRPGEAWLWSNSSPGMRSVAFHRLETNPDGTVEIAIGIRLTGLLAGLIGTLITGKTRRYLKLEAAGLKAASESAAARAASGSAAG